MTSERSRGMDQWMSRQNTNALRAFAAIGIMFVHIDDGITDVDNIFMCFGSIGYLCVGIFFFYTGYNLIYAWRNKGFNGFVMGKMTRVYIPFVVANLLFMILRAAGGWYTFEWKSSIQHILGAKLVNATLWYVLNVLFFEALFWIVFRLVSLGLGKRRDMLAKDKWVIGLALTATFLLYTLVYPRFANFTGSLKGKNESVPICILAGGFLQLWGENIIRWLRKYKVELFFLLFFALCVFHGNNMKGMAWKVMGFNLCDFLPPLLTALTFNLLLLGENLSHPLIQHIGTVSYEIYLLHYIFILGLRGDFIFIRNDYVYVLVYCVSLILAATAFHKVNGKLKLLFTVHIP